MRQQPERRPISALLSQVLVAFTVEFDNEFERRMVEAGYSTSYLSLSVWNDLMRFLAEGVVPRIDSDVKIRLACLERWGFVVLADGKREGWGSGRGIRTDTPVRLTQKGLKACEIWPPLFEVIERRWEKRFGKDQIKELRKALQAFLPDKSELSLPNILTRLLDAFRVEFDAESKLGLVFCANTIRVLSDKAIRAAEIPRLTGLSAEQSDIGWQLKPYVVVQADPAAKRGKVVKLSAQGIEAQETYYRLIGEIEKRWEAKYGKETLTHLRECLLRLFEGLAEGLVPSPGTIRAGEYVPALGRKAVAPAARQRRRDMVAQTEAFRHDPWGSLPHYPAWDFNRGFGP